MMAVRARWLAAGLAVLAIGFVAGRSSVAEEAAPGASSHVDCASPDDVQSRPAEAPSDRTLAGAVTAATAYAVALDGPALLDPATLRQVIEEVSIQDARGDLEHNLGAIADLLADNLGLTAEAVANDRVVWRSVPAGWRVVSYDGTVATVAIWGTGVALVDGRLVAPITWRTTSVDVRWERGGWRLVDLGSEPGPEPPTIDGRSDSEFAIEVADFSTFSFVPNAEGDR